MAMKIMVTTPMRPVYANGSTLSSSAAPDHPVAAILTYAQQSV